MKRRTLHVLAILLLAIPALAQSDDTALVRAFRAEANQATYLARHPEILRWIGKHPGDAILVAIHSAQPEQHSKNKAINDWVVAWPVLVELLAESPAQALAWADDPQPLADLGKKPGK